MRVSFDPHAILGLARGAKLADVKKAYYKLALENHPDKFGRSDEATQLRVAENIKAINKAYKILTGETERLALEDSENLHATDYPQISTNEERFSASYKRYFENTEKYFRDFPLERLTKADLERNFAEFNELVNNELVGTERYSHLYRATEDGVEYSDIYQFIAHLDKCSTSPAPVIDSTAPVAEGCTASSGAADFLNGNLNPKKAIDILLEFLQGQYYGQNLKSIQHYFQIQCDRLYQLDNPLLIFYQSIEVIFSVTSIEKDYQKVLNALEGIYALANLENETDVMNITRLMQDRYFRYLVINAHCYFWKDDKRIIDPSLFIKIKSEYAEFSRSGHVADESAPHIESQRNDHTLPQSVRYVESHMQKISSVQVNLADIYDCAYLLLDLSACDVTQECGINSLILAGLCFQFAAKKETEQSRAMAAEHVALSLYQKVMSYAHRGEAMLALYVSTHIAKYASGLAYNQSTLSGKKLALFLMQQSGARFSVHTDSIVDTVKGALKKSLYLIDIFPFYTSLQSSLDLESRKKYQPNLIRSLLQALLTQAEAAAHYDYTKLVYLAYENTIRKYCKKQTEQEERWIEEIALKSQVIDLLLKRDNSSSDDMAQLIDQPYIHMKRDIGGWFVPNNELDFPDEANIKIYKSFDGFEVDRATGQINFLMKEWQEGDPRSMRLFTDYDIFQMLSLKIAGGAISLEFVDPQLMYHPLQMLRFEPSHLKGTEYLKTLFMTDYLLKMLVSGNEVSANFPYLNRKIDNLLSLLPAHLRKILNFRNESEKKHAHRFWITTEAVERQETTTAQQKKVYYGDVKVTVQKRILQLDVYGNHVDVLVDNKNDSPEARFVAEMTQFYDEIGEYFPVFRRLKELVKIAGAVAESCGSVTAPAASAVSSGNSRNTSLETLDISDDDESRAGAVDAPLSGPVDVYQKVLKKNVGYFTMLFQKVSPYIKGAHPLSDIDWWNAALDKSIAERKAELQKLCTMLPKFSYRLDDSEIVQAYNEKYREHYDRIYKEDFDSEYQLNKNNIESQQGVHVWKEQEDKIVTQLKTRISQEVTELLAREFTQQSVLVAFNKRATKEYDILQKSFHKKFIDLRETLGETAYATCINAFLEGNCVPLARAFATKEHEQWKKNYLQAFTYYSTQYSRLKHILDDFLFKQAVDEFLSGNVERLAAAMATYCIDNVKKEREKEYQEMLLAGETKLPSTTVRIPAGFSSDGKNHIVYGGVRAYPKFCQRVTGSRPSFFTHSFSRDQVSCSTSSLISHYNSNPHVMRQTSTGSTPSFTHDPFAFFRARESARVARPVSEVIYRGLDGYPCTLTDIHNAAHYGASFDPLEKYGIGTMIVGGLKDVKWDYCHPKNLQPPKR